MDDRLPIEGAGAQHSAPDKVFQTFRKRRRHPATEPGGIAVFHGTVEPVCFWVAWVGFILLGVSVLGIVALQEYISQFFLFLPRLFVALVILFFGLLAASFFSRAALLAAVNVNFRSSRLLSISIRIIISIFALSMVFEVLGVAKETMLITFGTAFGAIMLSLAIAFGIGGKEVAREFLEKRLVAGKKEEKEDELSPL